MICPRKSPRCPWEEYACGHCWGNALYMSVRSERFIAPSPHFPRVSSVRLFIHYCESVLKSPTVTVKLSLYPFHFVSFCFVYFAGLSLDLKMFIIGTYYCCIEPFILPYNIPCLRNLFELHCILSDISIDTLLLSFGCYLQGISFFHSFLFSTVLYEETYWNRKCWCSCYLSLPESIRTDKDWILDTLFRWQRSEKWRVTFPKDCLTSHRSWPCL